MMRVFSLPVQSASLPCFQLFSFIFLGLSILTFGHPPGELAWRQDSSSDRFPSSRLLGISIYSLPFRRISCRDRFSGTLISARMRHATYAVVLLSSSSR
ncbi:hypothetical protein VTK73DRAFT_4469 [Phialemonium thermophilum]|uniref:Secreted protein n=1 Tax=Phialemonium thermophilum TaxID=223376 RepID=A0ABR3V9G9_9PEZI